eukprot:gene46046-57407_t
MRVYAIAAPMIEEPAASLVIRPFAPTAQCLREVRNMKALTAGLLGTLLLTGVAQADVFVSMDAKGSYVLSNVHRPGRHYERVIHEPESAQMSMDQQPQMIARQPYAELVSAA